VQFSELQEVTDLDLDLGSGSEELQTRSHTIIANHQFWAPHENGGGDRPRKVQFSELHNLRDLDLHLGSGWGLPTHQTRSKLDKLFVDVWTHPPSV